MKKLIIAILTICLILSGCSNTESLLDKGIRNYAVGKPVNDTVPENVLDQLDTMLAKYTGGFKVIDVNEAVIEVDDEEIPDNTQDETSQTTIDTEPTDADPSESEPTESEPLIVDSAADTVDDVYAILLDAISNTDDYFGAAEPLC